MMKQKLSLKGRALRYLSMREHSRIELARKLSAYAEEGDDIEAVLAWLEVEIQRVKANLSETESTRAIEVLHRKFPRPPEDYEQRLKQSRFLQQRGFSGKAIQQAMREPREDEDQ